MKSEDENNMEKENLYCSLAPKVSADVDKDNEYSKAIVWALNEVTVKNIALTGIYGAGKSSIIEKFKDEHEADKKYNFFNVSLASFDDHKKLGTKDIEECILQQIFYQVDSKNIPHSRFKKITHLPDKVIIKNEMKVWSLLLIGILVMIPESFNYPMELICKLTDVGYPFWLAFVLLISFVLLFFYISNLLIKFVYRKIKLSKLSFNKVGFEVEKKEDGESKSIFNKYMDEIIYFFEATDYNVIVFEDLDRFDNTEIFIKLRELNIIINNYENIKRKICFLYAIKDDIFLDKERTKFFDFIIPVIPFLNSSNSFEIFDKKIKSIGLNKVEVSNEYLLDIAPFINDMRLLDNIINEFKLYKIKLNESSIVDEKLLSIIVYKNICPNDFAQLLNNKGFVYSTLNNKHKIILNKKNEIKASLNSIENELGKVKIIQYTKLEDLEKQLLGLICEKISESIIISSINISVDEEGSYSVKSFIENDDIKYSEIAKIKINYQYSSFSKYSDSFMADDEMLEFIHDISNKKNRLNVYLDGEGKALKIKKESLLEEKRKLDNSTYAELAKVITVNHDTSYDDEKYDIAKFMLRRGYINETFQSYISYFHQGNLSIEENKYILSLKNEKNLGPLYELKNIKLLLTRLDIRDFKQTNFYNVYLIDYMLNNISVSDQHCRDCFEEGLKILCKDTEQNKDFFLTYFDYLYKQEDDFPHKVLLLIKIMSTRWCGTFHLLNEIAKEKAEDVYQRTLLLETLKCLNENELIAQNKGNCIRDTILLYEDFLTMSSEVEGIEKKILGLEIKFEKLKIEEKSKITDYIFENNCWVFNPNYMENLKRIYFDNCEEFYVKNYTIIDSSQYVWLKKFINENIEAYVKYMLLLENNNQDNYNSIHKLLHKENLSLDFKNRIIEKENYMFTNFDNIDTALWDKIIDEKKIKVNWGNVEKYYNEFKLTGKLLNYIKGEKETLSQNSLQSHDLSIHLLEEQDMSIYFLNKVVFDEQNFEYEDIQNVEESSFKLIVEKGLYAYSANNFNSLSENFPVLVPSYLNKAYYKEKFEILECEFNSVCVEQIFNSNVNLEIKKRVLDIIDFDNLNSVVSRIIVYFISDYCNFEDIELSKVKVLISKVGQESCIHLLNSKFNELSDANLIDMINKHEDLKNLLIYRKQVSFNINAESYKFLNELRERHIISSYAEKNNKLIAYTKQKIDI